MPGFPGISVQPALPLLPRDTNGTSILSAGPSCSLPHPWKSQPGWQTLVPWWAQSYRLWVAQLAAGSWRGPAHPLGEATKPQLARPSSTADFPQNPSQLRSGSSTWGRNCIFRPTLRTWTSILFCSQIYRVDFDSNILLSLQAQNCVCQQ